MIGAEAVQQEEGVDTAPAAGLVACLNLKELRGGQLVVEQHDQGDFFSCQTTGRPLRLLRSRQHLQSPLKFFFEC